MGFQASRLRRQKGKMVGCRKGEDEETREDLSYYQIVPNILNFYKFSLPIKFHNSNYISDYSTHNEGMQF